MELKVYDRYKDLKATFSPEDSSSCHNEVEGDSYVSVTFTTYECITLEVGDYILFHDKKYWILEGYTPKQEGNKKWNYSVKFYGAESLIKNALMLDADGSPVFAYTAPAREQLSLVVKNINRWMGNVTDWKAGDCVSTKNLVIDYSEGVYCNEALKKIADEAETEWWIDGTTVNIGRCEWGEPVTLGFEKGLRSIERDNADNVKFFTRLFPIGSSKNIDPEIYGYSRLQLPQRNAYVEKNTEYGIIEHFEKDAFDDIFPKRVGKVSGVRSEEAKDDDGNKFIIYYFSDDELPFDPNTYEIGGLVKHVIFQDGELAGRDFEVNYSSTKKEFEIITTWPYDDDTQLPGGDLIPETDKSYVLYNLRMPTEYYGIAEKEYLAAVNAYMENHCQDRSVYKAPTDYTYIKRNSIELAIGKRIRLESNRYFPQKGYRDSRITVIDQNLNRPGQADIQISDVLSQTSQSKMSDDINGVKTEVKTATTTFPDIIRSWDDVKPTDNNLFSARRSMNEFLNKKKEDTANKKMRFLEGIDINYFESGERGGRIDGDGNAELMTLVIRSLMRSTMFKDGLDGEGFQLWMSALDKLSHLTIDKLTVRQTMTVFELLIQKIRSIGGQFIVSAANGKISSVADNGDDYIIYFEQDNTFVAGDLMRCAVTSGTKQKSYWVEIAKADRNSVTVSKSEFSGILPWAGDECVLMGNTTNRLRQNLISISATEDGHPRVDVMDGVNGKNFSGCLRVRLGNLDGIKDDRFPLDNQPKGNGLYGDNVYLVGTFMLTTGEDILTKFNIMEGKIESAVEGLRTDFSDDKSYLENGTFADGMNKWDTENDATFFLLGNRWIWTNDAPYSNKTNYTTVKNDIGRTAVFIKNKYIQQKHENFRSIPSYTDTNDEGEKKPEAVYLSFFYRCVTGGRLRVEFENADKTGFENFNMFDIDENIVPTDGYVTFSRDGLWNGTGDFKLSFTGEIYVYMLMLSTDKVNALAYKYKTLFEQSERLVKISAAVFDKDEKMLEETGLMITSKYSGLYAIDGEGNLKSFVGAGQEGVKIKAENIVLEGLVTANGNFKILEDGSVESANGKFTGEIQATKGKLGYFLIDEQGLYYGDPTKWTDSTYKQNLASIRPGLIKIQSQVGYFQAGDIANIKVAIGNGADPSITDSNGYCNSAGYFYRQMNSSENYYFPAIKIISDNVVNRDVALYTKGAIVCDGGLVSSGHFNNADSVTVLDLSFGTSILISNTTEYRRVYLPKLSVMMQLMSSSDKFVVPLKLICQYNNTKNVAISFQDGESTLYFRNYNGGKWSDYIDMGAGDILELLLIYDGTNYYAQVMDSNS